MVRYVGPCEERGAGIYVGVELDEPMGDCDGAPHFTCKPSHGAYAPVGAVEVGDFPELDLMDLDSDEL